MLFPRRHAATFSINIVIIISAKYLEMTHDTELVALVVQQYEDVLGTEWTVVKFPYSFNNRSVGHGGAELF